MSGQGRLGDRAQAPIDAHGCPACPHPAIGPAIAGSPDTQVNGRPALRVDDPGIHMACCGTNTWTAVKGALTVFINGKAAHRKLDATRHCGGPGQLIEGSPNVIVEDNTGGGGGAGGGGGSSSGGGGGGGGNASSPGGNGGDGSGGNGGDGNGGNGSGGNGGGGNGGDPGTTPGTTPPDEPKKVAHLFEIDDAFFRNDSAVFLPDGETPTLQTPSHQLTGASLVATLLRHVQQHPDREALVAGHTDTTASVQYDIELSQRRANGVRATITGDRDAFATVCLSHHLVDDYQQILTWVAQTRGWPCDPGGVDGRTGPETTQAIRGFQHSYNTQGKAGNTGAPDLVEHGMVDRATWAAFHDCYQASIADELGAELAELPAYRARVVWTGPGAVGCGKSHPIEAVGVDNYRSAINRRVELLVFDPGNTPVLACHGGGSCNPGACDLYNPDKFTLVPEDPMLSAKPWKATWSDDVIRIDTSAELVLEAPGLPAGTPVTFVVSEVGHGELGTVEAAADEGGATAYFADWWDDAREVAPVELRAGQDFAVVRYTFVATAADRSETSPPIAYADVIEGELLDNEDARMVDTDYIVHTAWGTRTGRTDAEARVDEQALPPGGATLVVAALARPRK